MHSSVIQQVSMVDEGLCLKVETIKIFLEYNECIKKLRGG